MSTLIISFIVKIVLALKVKSKLYFAYTVDSMRALGKKIVIFDIQRSILADRVIKSA